MLFYAKLGKIWKTASYIVERLEKFKKKLISLYKTTIMTQDELAVLIANKDEKAFSLLYDLYSKSVFSVICNRVRDREQAELLLEEVFVYVWKHIGDYNESKGRLYSWIINIARKKANEKVNSHSNSHNFITLLDDSTRVPNRIDSIGVHDLVKKLKPKCIQVIDMLFYKGNSPQAVADELEIPLAAVQTQNRNCINDLRNYLQL